MLRLSAFVSAVAAPNWQDEILSQALWVLARQMGSIPHVGTISRNILNLQSSTLQVVYAEGTLELVRGWQDQDVPVIAFVQTLELPYWGGTEARHAVVVVGIDDENVYLLDPARDPDIVPVSLGVSLLPGKTGWTAVTL